MKDVVNEALRNSRPQTEVVTGFVNINVSDYDKLEAAYPETHRAGFYRQSGLSPRAWTALAGYIAQRFSGPTGGDLVKHVR